MAVVGQQLLEPEEGWFRIDNTNPILNYVGSWTHTSNSSAYNKTISILSTNTVGSVSFEFTGKKLRIIGLIHQSYSTNHKLVIDGRDYYFSQYSSTTKHAILCLETLELSTGKHIATISNPDSKFLSIDAIDIEEPRDNKSFILFGDGYKRLDEGSPAIGAVNVVPKMTSSTFPSGEVKTSSSHSAPYDGWKVFDRNVDTASRWIANGLTRPQWLQYDFGKEVVSSGYGLSPYSVANTTGWRFQAGNDGSNWIDLDTQSDQILTMGKTNYYGVQNIEGYRYYRFFFTEGSASESVMFNEIEILDSGKTATPLLWKTVSPILPTLPQFQSEGMDDLSIFDHKVQQISGSTKRVINSSQDQSDLYKTPIDLNKILDLRSIKIS